MKQIGHISLSAFLLFWAFSLPALADLKADDKRSINPFEIKGLVIGREIKVDWAFGVQHRVKVPAPFSFVVPIDETVTYYMAFPPEIRGAEYFLLSFANADKKLVENLRMIDVTIPVLESKKRIKGTVVFLVEKALPIAFKGYGQSRYLGSRVGRIGDCDAVDVLGEYVDPVIGPMLVRLVAILNPESEHCVLAVANINPALSDVKIARDAARKGLAAKAIATFKYLP